jgi:hypothetical protein
MSTSPPSTRAAIADAELDAAEVPTEALGRDGLVALDGEVPRAAGVDADARGVEDPPDHAACTIAAPAIPATSATITLARIVRDWRARPGGSAGGSVGGSAACASLLSGRVDGSSGKLMRCSLSRAARWLWPPLMVGVQSSQARRR